MDEAIRLAIGRGLASDNIDEHGTACHPSLKLFDADSIHVTWESCRLANPDFNERKPYSIAA